MPAEISPKNRIDSIDDEVLMMGESSSISEVDYVAWSRWPYGCSDRELEGWHVKFLEYQAKEVFAQAGIPVPSGRIADTPESVRAIAEEMGGKVVVKAQVPIGGRGKAGGIAVVSSPDEAEREGRRILNMHISEYPVRRVLVEEAAEIEQEYYLAVTLDRAAQSVVVILSSEGGMDIEEIAATQPDKVIKVWIDTALGFRGYHIRQLMSKANVPAEQAKQMAPILKSMYDIFMNSDAQLVEINPCAGLSDGRVVALDGKMEIDESAYFRQADLIAEQVDEAEHPLERKAKEKGLAYVKLDGEVGIIGNGAGLVMTTLDMIQRSGGKPANFLDIGGGAKAEVVQNSLSILLSDPDVKSILLNVFGGITRGDEVAKGLLSVFSEMDVDVPVVVRLAGTRAEEGRALLEGTNLIAAETFQEAAQKAVDLAKAR